jgi:hypothetical protein
VIVVMVVLVVLGLRHDCLSRGSATVSIS